MSDRDQAELEYTRMLSDSDMPVHEYAVAQRERVIALERALREAREFIVVVECEEGLTTDNLIGQIDAALNGESK